MICILRLKNLKSNFDLNRIIIFHLRKIKCQLHMKILVIFIVQLKAKIPFFLEKLTQIYSCIYLHDLREISNVTLCQNHLIFDLTQKLMF